MTSREFEEHPARNHTAVAHALNEAAFEEHPARNHIAIAHALNGTTRQREASSIPRRQSSQRNGRHIANSQPRCAHKNSIDYGSMIIITIAWQAILKVILVGTQNPLHFIFQAKSTKVPRMHGEQIDLPGLRLLRRTAPSTAPRSPPTHTAQA